MKIRDWLRPMLIEWGKQRRRILTGRLVRRDGSVHEDGWAKTSVADKLNDGGITGGSGGSHQHFPEVYTGMALLVWRAWRECEDADIRRILHEHYVMDRDEAGRPIDASDKAERMGLSRTVYFQRLEVAEGYLAGRIDQAKRPADALA